MSSWPFNVAFLLVKVGVSRFLKVLSGFYTRALVHGLLTFTVCGWMDGFLNGFEHVRLLVTWCCKVSWWL